MKAQTLALGFAILSVALVSATPADGPPADQTADALLKDAIDHPQSFMFGEHVVTSAESKSFDLVVTSATNVKGEPDRVYVRPGTMRVFRADADKDDFTRQGGWYWRAGKTEGKSQFKEPGAVILVVRGHDGTVHWYSLKRDFRC